MINPYILQNIPKYYSSNSLDNNYNNNVLTYESTYDSKLLNVRENMHDSDFSLDISFSNEIFIPLNILHNHSSLEAIVLYLKENLKLKYNEISKLLNRNQRTIWVTYANAKKKKVAFNLEDSSEIFLPLSIFLSRNCSILETIVFYLRTNHLLSFNQISHLLGKNYRTIWTIYRRALKKLESEMNKENNNTQ